MTLSWWGRIAAAALLMVIALLLIPLHGTGAQTARNAGSSPVGRQFVEAWCTECHSVERATAGTGQIAPDFTAIAEQRSTTALSLRAFLQSDHKTMPNFILEPADAEDIIAYILSLRQGKR